MPVNLSQTDVSGSGNLSLDNSDLVICDFDGTISQQDVGLFVMEALDLQEAWDIEMRWRRGEISSMECLSEQWSLVQLPTCELLTLLDSVPLDPDFPSFVELCRERGASLVVVSDGLDLYVDRLLRQMGLEPGAGQQVLERQGNCLPRFTNHAQITAEGVKISFPHRSDLCARCGNCKTAHLFALRRHSRRTIYIGDAHSDQCPARYADIVFAKSHLAEFCRQHRLPHIVFDGFSDILEELG